MSQKQLSPVRRSFLQFLAAIAVLHVAAIALYYALELKEAVPSTQRRFAWVWMSATVAVIIVGLQRIKRARRRGR